MCKRAATAHGVRSHLATPRKPGRSVVFSDLVEQQPVDERTIAEELDRVWQRDVDSVDDADGNNKRRCELPVLERLIAASPWHHLPRPTALRRLLTEASSRSARAEVLQQLFDLEPHASHLPRDQRSTNVLGEFGSRRAKSTKRRTLREDFARALVVLSGDWKQITTVDGDEFSPPVNVPSATHQVGRLSRLLQRDMDVAAHTDGETLTLSGGGYVSRTVEPDIIETLLTQDRDVIVKADPGYGKSTLLWSLARTLTDHSTVLPVLISAAWLLADGDEQPLLTETAVLDELKTIATEHQIVVLLDTADILLHSESSRMRTLLLLNQLSDNGIRWCAASRPLEAEALKVDGVRIIQLDAYDDTELPVAVKTLGGALCPHMGTVELTRRIQDAVARGLPVSTVCRSPLMLRILFELNAPNEPTLELDVTDLYDQYWQRRVTSDIRTDALDTDTESADLSEVTAALGIALLAAGTTVSPRAALVTTLHSHDLVTGPRSRTRAGMATLEQRGVLQKAGPVVGFFHQTMFEFAAAQGILERQDPSAGLQLLADRVREQPADLFVGAVLEQALILTGRNPLLAAAAASVARELASSEHLELQAIGMVYLAHHPGTTGLDLAAIEPVILRKTALLLPTINHQRWADVERLIDELWRAGNKPVRLELMTTLARLAIIQGSMVKRILQRHTVIEYCATTDPRSPAVQLHGPRTLARIAGLDSALARSGFLTLLRAVTSIGTGRAVASTILSLVTESWALLGSADFLGEVAILIERSQADADTDAKAVRESLSLLFAAEWALRYAQSDGPEAMAWSSVVADTVRQLVHDDESVIAGARLIATFKVIAAMDADDPRVEATLEQVFSMPGPAAPRQLHRSALPLALQHGGSVADEICRRFSSLLLALRDREIERTRESRMWGEIARTTLGDERVPLERVAASIPAMFKSAEQIWATRTGLAMLAPVAATVGVVGARRCLEHVAGDPSVLDEKTRAIVLERSVPFATADPLLRAVVLSVAVATGRSSSIIDVLSGTGGADALRPDIATLKAFVTSLLAGTQHQQRDGGHLWAALISHGLIAADSKEISAALKRANGAHARASLIELLPLLRNDPEATAAGLALCLEQTADWIRDGQEACGRDAPIPERKALPWEAARAAYLELIAFDPHATAAQWPQVRAFTLTPRTNGKRTAETTGFGNAARYISRLLESGESAIATDALIELVDALREPTYATKQTRTGAHRLRGAIRSCFQRATDGDRERLLQQIQTAAAPVATVIARTAIQERPEAFRESIGDLRRGGVAPAVVAAINEEARMRQRTAGTGIFLEVLA